MQMELDRIMENNFENMKLSNKMYRKNGTSIFLASITSYNIYYVN